jgi:hypothetical protein
MYYSPKYPRRRVAAVGSHQGEPASTITSLTVLPANGIQADGVDGTDAADANGWVAKIVLPDDGVSTFDPTKVVLTVKDYGYDASGNLLSPGSGGPVRTITGRAIIRKQWSNQTQRLNSASGGTRTIYVSLSDTIYASSVVSASASAGYYGSAQAGSIASVTNSSTRTYPKPTFAWLNAQHDRATGANLYVEAVAFHRWAMNGRQVACIKYRATDAQAVPNSSAEVTVSAPTLATLCTQGQPPECYAANISLANLTQADLCLVNAKVYPFLGDATAVLDLSVDGTAPTGNWSDPAPQTTLRFVCDKTGGYGGALGYVRPTGTLLGTDTSGVFTALQPYGLTNAQCYASVSAAGQALAAWNNANKGHNDVGGAAALLTDDGVGGAVAHTAVGHSRTPGKCTFDVRKDPNAVGAVSISLAATTSVTSLTRFVGVNIAHSAGNGFDGANAAGRIIGFENLTIDCAGAATPTPYRNPLVSMRNVTVTNPRSDFFAGFNGTDQLAYGLLLGVVMEPATGAPIVGRARAVIGGRFKLTGLELRADNCVVTNNKFMAIADANLREIGRTQSAVVQNIWESARPVNGGALVALAGDGTTVAIENFLFMHNSLPATDRTGRFNAGYTDVQDTGTGGLAAGVVKRIHFRANIFGQYDTKSDTFASGSQGGSATNTGRTGNWSIRYHCGDEGNVAYSSNQTGDNAPNLSGSSWLGEQWNASNAIGPVAVTYTSNLSGEGAAGGGTYTLSGASNPAYDRVAGPSTSGITHNGVAVSRAALAFDIAGALRKQDGTGAAGAYERP